jgi:hypothetical protein
MRINYLELERDGFPVELSYPEHDLHVNGKELFTVIKEELFL